VRWPWRRSARGGGDRAASSGEGGRKGKGARPGGPAQPARLLGAKRSDGPVGCWADWAKS
jgi:hypothetical protein